MKNLRPSTRRKVRMLFKKFTGVEIGGPIMNVANQMGEWEHPASCRDKGWDGVDEGALCLSWLGDEDPLEDYSPHMYRVASRTGTRPPVPTGRGDASTSVIRKTGSVSLYPVGIARNKTLHHFIPHILVKIFPLENLWLQWVMQNIVANES
jgi:hypothetical protein